MATIEELMAISALSTEPIRPKGKWIEIGGFEGEIYYDCSECGESFCLIDGLTADKMPNYCPNCGADMRPEPYKGRTGEK